MPRDTSYYGQHTTASDLDMIERSEDRLANLIESGKAELLDVCTYFGIRPSVIREMVAGLDKHDEITISAAIVSGIHRVAPSLDDCAHWFVGAVYVPVSLAMAAE